MPKIEKVFTLEVGVEQFLSACSPVELQEVEMLILSPKFQDKIRPPRGSVPYMKNPPPPPEKPQFPNDR